MCNTQEEAIPPWTGVSISKWQILKSCLVLSRDEVEGNSAENHTSLVKDEGQGVEASLYLALFA